MTNKTAQENQTLIAFWDKAFTPTEEGQAQDQDLKDLKALAPSEKLFRAACSL